VILAALVILAVVVALLGGGVALQKSRRVSGTVVIEASEQTVYGLVSDLKSGWPEWSPLVPAGSGLVIDYGTPASGAGATVKWTGKAGTGALTLTACARDVEVSYRTTLSLGGMSALGKIELKSVHPATVVSWSDELSVGANPAWRWLALAMDGLRERNVQQGLAALKRVAEQRG
jgi:hypothetical protein